MFRFVLLALPLALLSACPLAEQESSSSPPCDGTQHPLEPGASYRGHDAQALLAPYFGTFEGSLTWASGSTTGLTLTVADDDDPAIFGSCNGVPGVYAYGTVTLQTDDGGLDEQVSAILDATLPEGPAANPPPAVTPSGMPDWTWQGDVASHLPIDVEAYADSSLVVALDWEQGADAPTSGILRFSGHPSAAPDQRDELTVATLAFP